METLSGSLGSFWKVDSRGSQSPAPARSHSSGFCDTRYPLPRLLGRPVGRVALANRRRPSFARSTPAPAGPGQARRARAWRGGLHGGPTDTLFVRLSKIPPTRSVRRRTTVLCALTHLTAAAKPKAWIATSPCPDCTGRRP
ncbi:hypothetical protein AAFF_G00120900 [Aldrovandia affinis]|uniref:Uncharacterized protein n=1 Tax=Aldrovandia affinis TaxID=143900 RepID=A0AAD7WA00_9TELE|nr:hypothetical protein AAFF_G00120900 [Aldrovandia affinis]